MELIIIVVVICILIVIFGSATTQDSNDNLTNVNAHLELHYIDVHNKTTHRTVRIRKFDSKSVNGLMMGHCELRNETRTFKYKRIKQCVDLDTGEVITDVRKYLNTK